jgi:hypothetical protein
MSSENERRAGRSLDRGWAEHLRKRHACRRSAGHCSAISTEIRAERCSALRSPVRLASNICGVGRRQTVGDFARNRETRGRVSLRPGRARSPSDEGQRVAWEP